LKRYAFYQLTFYATSLDYLVSITKVNKLINNTYSVKIVTKKIIDIVEK